MTRQMPPRTHRWQLLSSLLVLLIGAAIALPLYRFADRDDAPGGMVIACLIFIAAAALASWIGGRQHPGGKHNSAT